MSDSDPNAAVSIDPRPARTPRGCTNFKTRHLARLLSRRYDAALADVGLKITQYSLLTHLAHMGAVSPGELARRMGLDASTLTRNLRPLLAADWVAQDAGADARSRRIALTEAGRAKQIAAVIRWKAAQHAVNELLGPDRVLALHDLLDECASRLQGATPSRED